VDNRTAATSVQVQMVCKNLVHSIYEILLFEDSLLNSKVQVSLLKCKSILCNLQAAKHNNIITEFKVGFLYVKPNYFMICKFFTILAEIVSFVATGSHMQRLFSIK
jgi:hypothetical protein